MNKYSCIECEYIYDPVEGDAISNIPKGVLFQELPEDWRCPLCDASKDHFEKIV